MGFWDRFFGGKSAAPTQSPKASAPDGGVLITTTQQLEEAVAGGSMSLSGERVNANSAMKVAAVYACVRIRSGAVATMPLHIKRRIDPRTREDASDTELWKVICRRPNKWQKPAQFRRMLQAHVMLRGNGYAMIVRTAVKKEPQALIPMHPDRVETKQKDDLSLEYTWTRKDGRRVVLQQDQVFHLYCLTLDGFTGVTPITYARETLGVSLAMERHGAKTFKNGAIIGHVLRHPNKLGKEGQANLRSSLEEYRSGGESEGKDLILEEGMDVTRMAMTSVDAQWIESRKFSRSDIAMFFGVPPHMIGDTEKSTSWGTGIEQQTQGFVAFTLEDDLTMWEEGITADLTPEDSNLYAKFNRSALVKGDIKTRTAAYATGLQWGWLSPNEVRELEDRNPRDDGDIYYPPPNTAGNTTPPDEKDDPDEPAKPS
ncbi:phage portal protein [Mesorhizobium sp. YC-39]|uniref:phage portal protein n=1 Tax=unclassified Mesorhizobium TaxID=325217 RepID=UPI0021E77C62|nr:MULTISPECIES: phage portal protein [unclassified Mesorhizobium]MCV3209613.1 phage portal protein [Mesorhizobium sp. YC-2]MCV3230143.1 phage portal protein [Mesorhizobium sp. YC-39]